MQTIKWDGEELKACDGCVKILQLNNRPKQELIPINLASAHIFQRDMWAKHITRTLNLPVPIEVRFRDDTDYGTQKQIMVLVRDWNVKVIASLPLMPVFNERVFIAFLNKLRREILLKSWEAQKVESMKFDADYGTLQVEAI